jgi:hypothetical protein
MPCPVPTVCRSGAGGVSNIKNIRSTIMNTKLILLAFLFIAFTFAGSLAQTLPLVYNVENTGANCPIPYLPSFSNLPVIQPLPDPFEWADGRGRISHFSDWRYRRAEIGAQLQNYEIGVKPPRPDTLTATYSNDTLRVFITVGSNTLTLTSPIIMPSGTGPFPAVIAMVGPFGYASNNIFASRNIAQIEYIHNQVTTYGSPSTADPYYRLYPALNTTNTGQYSAWIWGVSRIIDGLELVKDSLPIDLAHLAVIGCSYAGKMALFAGAFDERVALTIAQESGGGGATSWRYSQSEPNGTVEKIDNTDYNWFMNSMSQFAGANVSRMPEDHHELMALVAPRALWASGNPDYTWLSNPSCYVCSKGAQQVYNALGIPDRFGFSIIGGHAHCAIPDTQVAEIGAFADRFLLGDTTANTSNISDNPYSIDLSPWITWTNPTLTSGTSFFGKASLVYPANQQKGLDSAFTFTWNKASNADIYLFQLSSDAMFTDNIVDTASTTDTSKSVTGLLAGKTYYWRVQDDSAGSQGPWSTVWNFSVYIPLPAKPQLISAEPLRPDRADSVVFKWARAQYADHYLLQISHAPDFAVNFYSNSIADTTITLVGYSAGLTYYWRVQASNVTGSSSWSDSSFTLVVTDVAKEGIPTEYSISQNYPNPFNPSAKIKFSLPKAALTKIVLYDVLGREIRTLVNKELGAGYYEITVDASTLPSGVYFYRFQSGDFAQTKKMVLTK